MIVNGVKQRALVGRCRREDPPRRLPASVSAVFVAELRPGRTDSGILPTQADAELIITTDRVPTDLLARQYGLMTPELYGRYTVRVCVSDICAMGAQSAGLVITSALPVLHEASVRYGTDVGRLISEGYALGVPVVGGDTKWASDESRECYGRGFCAPWRCVAPHQCVSGRSCVRNRPGWHCWRRASMVWLRTTTLVNYILTTLRRSARRSSVRFLGLTWSMRDSARPLLFQACMDITDGLGQSLLEFGAASGVRLVIDPGGPAAVASDPCSGQSTRCRSDGDRRRNWTRPATPGDDKIRRSGSFWADPDRRCRSR